MQWHCLTACKICLSLKCDTTVFCKSVICGVMKQSKLCDRIDYVRYIWTKAHYMWYNRNESNYLPSNSLYVI